MGYREGTWSGLNLGFVLLHTTNNAMKSLRGLFRAELHVVLRLRREGVREISVYHQQGESVLHRFWIFGAVNMKLAAGQSICVFGPSTGSCAINWQPTIANVISVTQNDEWAAILFYTHLREHKKNGASAVVLVRNHPDKPIRLNDRNAKMLRKAEDDYPGGFCAWVKQIFNKSKSRKLMKRDAPTNVKLDLKIEPPNSSRAGSSQVELAAAHPTSSSSPSSSSSSSSSSFSSLLLLPSPLLCLLFPFHICATGRSNHSYSERKRKSSCWLAQLRRWAQASMAAEPCCQQLQYA
eukprot:g13677.t1